MVNAWRVPKYGTATLLTGGEQMKKYIRPFTKYRKAGIDDIKCLDCVHYRRPDMFQSRGRCGEYPAVGKNNSCVGGFCDGAAKKATV